MLQSDRVYSNHGNLPLVDLLDSSCGRVIDVGCGAGDNALLLKSRYPSCQVFGVTNSEAEARLAKPRMRHCWVLDIEQDLPADLTGHRFDAVLFSHVLEHLRDPAGALRRFSSLLRNGGHVVIAVPNVLSWRMRLTFLFGRFEYETVGVLDDTHLRFFTFFTAERYLLSQSPDLEVVYKGTTGSVPLWWLRRYILPGRWSERIDAWGCRHWPNLFGWQVLLKAIKK
jgi:SAM-dependent methyltransferase